MQFVLDFVIDRKNVPTAAISGQDLHAICHSPWTVRHPSPICHAFVLAKLFLPTYLHALPILLKSLQPEAGPKRILAAVQLEGAGCPIGARSAAIKANIMSATPLPALHARFTQLPAKCMNLINKSRILLAADLCQCVRECVCVWCGCVCASVRVLWRSLLD